MQHFMDDLARSVQQLGNPVLVGLDPRWEMLPTTLVAGGAGDDTSKATVYEKFCCEVIDVVAPLVPAVKPQAAFFEELGPAGMQALAGTIAHAQQRGLLVVFDGKRNDIGSTATAYARGILGRDESAWRADALTVSPYLGDDSLQPFVDVAVERACGVFALVKTSNPGGGTFQDLPVTEPSSGEATRLYHRVAALVENLAEQTCGNCGYGAVGAVVGATYPEQLAELRSAMPQTWFLVPGFGSQGGTAHDVAAAFDGRGLGAIVNSSRGIIFAHRRAEYANKFGDTRWQQAVEAATREMIAQLRAETPAGRLGAG